MGLLGFSGFAFNVLQVSELATEVDYDEEDEPALESTASGDGSLIKGSEKDNADEKDDAIFIPLGLTYQLPRTFYKGSDPEWQSFIQLSRNKKKCEALKNELTGTVGQYVGVMPQMERALGKGSYPKKFWLDIEIPDGPPPEYERKGLELLYLDGDVPANQDVALRYPIITSPGPLVRFILYTT
ncbi:MAG: hypothetical protein Q9221_002261 [Calogaya cf. arnoldii]